jgi:hypothetical protein
LHMLRPKGRARTRRAAHNARATHTVGFGRPAKPYCFETVQKQEQLKELRQKRQETANRRRQEQQAAAAAQPQRASRYCVVVYAPYHSWTSQAEGQCALLHGSAVLALMSCWGRGLNCYT